MVPLMTFKFVDLFAGIGGFHAALGALGGECVYASEWDKDAARIYERNWNVKPDGDITLAANDEVMDVPEHDVLVGGFPCQSRLENLQSYCLRMSKTLWVPGIFMNGR